MLKRIDVPLFFLNISFRMTSKISTGRGEIDKFERKILECAGREMLSLLILSSWG